MIRQSTLLTQSRSAGRGNQRESDDGPVPDAAVLGDDHDAFADEVAVAVRVFELGLVDDADAAADAGVLVDDRVLDDRVRPDADRRDAARFRGAHVVPRLVEVGAGEQAVAYAPLRADAAADADDRVVDLGAVQDAALGDEGAADVAAFQLRRG